MLESDEKDAEEMAQHEDGSSIPTLGRRHTASRMSRSVRARLVCRSLSSIIPKRATRARRGAQDILFPTKGSRSANYIEGGVPGGGSEAAVILSSSYQRVCQGSCPRVTCATQLKEERQARDYTEESDAGSAGEAQDILFPTKGPVAAKLHRGRRAWGRKRGRHRRFPLRSARRCLPVSRALVRVWLFSETVYMRHTVQRQREPVGSSARLRGGASRFELEYAAVRRLTSAHDAAIGTTSLKFLDPSARQPISNSNTRRYEGWTSADAAGLAILPGLVRDDEVYCSGEIQRFSRYRADDRRRRRACALAKISRASPTLSRECSARQRTSGLIVADNGSDMFVTGTMDPHWNNDVPNPAFRALISDDFGRLSRLALRTNPPCCDFENSCNNGAFRLKAPHTYTIGSP